jgi:cysteine synthase
MIASHKVLAAYACLAPRVLAGQFDPNRHRAIWPSTGNYCRGGAAISKIMACRGVAILPEMMSQARFRWLEKWTMVPDEDIIATYGCESNVKEIYDKCNELEQDASNIVFNQFSEFGNHLAHYLCTGKAIETVFEHLRERNPELKLRLYSSATGSAGTLAAGDYLREKYGSRTIAIEALECPTLLYNGFGGHNIQGIGDKHVPLIHNAMTTDFVNGISDLSTDSLLLLFNTEVGRSYLRERRHVPEHIMAELDQFGFSSICNILAAIKTAKHLKLGPNDLVATVASDGASMYEAEKAELLHSRFNGRFDELTAAEVYGQHILGATVDHVLECTSTDRERIFNLGYYTWVEQQGIEFKAFMERKKPEFWCKLRELLPAWDKLIDKFNEEATGPL